MPRFSTIRPWLGLLLISAPAEASLAPQASVSLSGWTGPASTVATNRGPGEPLFLLRARARWSSDAPRDRGRFEVQVTLPGGRVERRPMRPGEGPGSPIVTVQIPAAAVRNLRPEAVRIEASLVDPTTGALLSNTLAAGIDQFPSPSLPGSRQPSGPFSRGRPLEAGVEGGQPLPNPGPDGWRFVRVVTTADRPGFFIATTEATNQQVADRLAGYDPNAGRSDEFALDAPDQPAINLSPEAAETYLEALRDSDPAGVPLRLPTRSEWEVAARAGRETDFWWGNVPVFPDGANFLGPEPGEAADATVPGVGAGRPYAANPWGLIHTFGNVAEWASEGGREGSTSYARMGGHFRNEPGEALDPPVVDDPGATGPDPYVGLRPAFDLDAEAGAALIRDRLAAETGLSGVAVRFDPDRATATLSGKVAGPGDRRRAVELLAPLWFLSAVIDELATPAAEAGRLARIGAPVGPGSLTNVLGRSFVRIPVSVSWSGPLPVQGSDWWVNVFGPNGGHWAHRLETGEPGRPTILASVPTELIGPDRTAAIGLSLGAPSASTADPGLVSAIVRVPVGP